MNNKVGTVSNAMPLEKWGQYNLKGWKKVWISFCHCLPPFPYLRRVAMLMRKPIKVVLVDWVDVSVWGLKLRLLPKGNLSEQRILFLPQFFDRVERLAIAKSLSQGGVFVDIGANIGSYSFWVASLGKDIKIEAFEPDVELCQRMQFNLSTNSIHNVHIHQLALGDRSGTSTLKRNEENRGQTRVVESTGASQGNVRIERLTDFLQNEQVDNITALKIDVEGNEVSVLKPLFESQYKHLWPRLIVCEIEKPCVLPADSPPWKLLNDVGYVLQSRTKLNGIFVLHDPVHT